MPKQPSWVIAPFAYRIVVAACAILVFAAAALTVFGGLAPWYFLVACWIGGTVILAPAVGWSAATWLVVGGALFAAQWVMVVNPHIGLPLDVTQVVLMVLAIMVAGVVAALRLRGPVEYPRVRVVDTIVVLAPALASAAILLAADLIRGSASVTWAMAGDAQFNTVLARIIAADGGATRSNVDVISLAQGLMAMVHLPGRKLIGADDLLIHDIVRQSDLWILMILLASVLGGAIAAYVLRDAPVVLRVLTVLGAAAIPLTWHLTGYAITAGFYNVDLAYLALELCIFFWLVLRDTPWLRLGALLALTTVLLGAWTPLAVIPVILSCGALIVALRSRPGPRPWALVAAILAAAQLVIFAIVFILPTFLTAGASLNQEGAILGLPRALVIAVAAVLVAIAVVLLIGPRNSLPRSLAGGSLLFVLGDALGVGFLYFQNRHLPNPWIYYPIKFAWIGLEIVLLLIWLSLALMLHAGGRRRIGAIAALVAAGVAVVGVATLNPPRYGGYLSYLPLVQIAVSQPTTEEALPVLSDYAGERVVFSRFLGDDDTFMNQWQFQLSVRSAEEPIRSFAYRPVETQVDFCDAARAWGGDMDVITDDARWAAQLNASCGDLLDAIVVEPPR